MDFQPNRLDSDRLVDGMKFHIELPFRMGRKLCMGLRIDVQYMRCCLGSRHHVHTLPF